MFLFLSFFPNCYAKQHTTVSGTLFLFLFSFFFFLPSIPVSVLGLAIQAASYWDWTGNLQCVHLRQPWLIKQVTGRNHFRIEDSWIICFQAFIVKNGSERPHDNWTLQVQAVLCYLLDCVISNIETMQFSFHQKLLCNL